MIGAKHDTMDPKAMEEQSKLVQKGRYLYCPNGSHLAMYDDQKVFMNGVIDFIEMLTAAKFKSMLLCKVLTAVRYFFFAYFE